MAKFYGSAVKTGKLGSSVFAIRNGEVIERQYQPIVSNPNTPAQIAARARLKLMSQLAAVMSDVIAIPKQGNVSSRNLFVKTNYSRTSYDTTNNSAQVTLQQIQLTRGVLPLTSFNNAVRSNSGITVTLPTSSVGLDVDRVVYISFRKVLNSLEFGGSTVVNEPGPNNQWQGVLPPYSGEVVLYAYGIRLNTEAARVIFGNISVPSAESVAKLVVTRRLLDTDVTLTKTVSYLLAAAE